jgi:hypothetical protein
MGFAKLHQHLDQITTVQNTIKALNEPKNQSKLLHKPKRIIMSTTNGHNNNSFRAKSKALKNHVEASKKTSRLIR